MKKTIAMIAVVATVSVVGAGVSEASTKKSVVKVTSVTNASRPSIAGMDDHDGAALLDSVLAGLVTKGTLTQPQVDAIKAALQAARPTGVNAPKGMNGPRGTGLTPVAKQALILSTLQIDAATLKAGFDAGKSLATIAGTPAKVTALTNALVAAENTAIDAAVTAGKLTAAQALTAKAAVPARVTAEINQVRPTVAMGMARGRGHK